MADNTILIIGASSGIATSLIKEFVDKQTIESVIAISRKKPPAVIQDVDQKIEWLLSDNSESSILKIVDMMLARNTVLDQVIICNGVLHDTQLLPEKRVEDIKLQSLQAVMHINAFIPMLWVKNLKPLLRRSAKCTITAFSARVGSIEDNGKGGWYAYRASKAALNMLMKTASIELQREPSKISLLLFHPGTTDTNLSKPFQKRIAKQSVFEPSFVAKRLLKILEDHNHDEEIQFKDWKGEEIAW